MAAAEATKLLPTAMHPLAEAAIDWALEELLSGLQVE
jgi:hypothetical protein